MTLDMERGPQTIEWGFVDRWVRLYVNVSSTFLTTMCPEPVLANRRATYENLPRLRKPTHQRMLLLCCRPWRITLLTADSSRSAGCVDRTRCTRRVRL
jgi:hypothetical protein